MSLNNFKNKKVSRAASIFLSIFLLFNVVFVNTANAQLTVAVANPITMLYDIGEGIYNNIGAALGSGLAAATGYFMDRIAYDTAVWIASGDKANSPVFWQNPSQYFTEVGSGTAGEFIAGLSDDAGMRTFLNKYGISNLCVPPDLNLQLVIKLNLLKQRTPSAARCDIRAIEDAYANLGTGEYWKTTGLAFQPGKNAISNLGEIDNVVDRISFLERENARQDAALKGQAKSPEEKISGNAKAAVETVKQTQAAQAPTEQAKETKADARSTKDLLYNGKYLAAAGGVGTLFLNTLANKSLQKLMSEGGLSSSVKDVFGISKRALCALGDQSNCPELSSAAGSNSLLSEEAQSIAGREAAEAAFADFLTPKISEIDQYTYLSSLFSKCADNPNPFCGAIDDGLNGALSQSASGQNATVKSALEGGQLHGDWKLLPPSVPCEAKSYCYNNLVKLRALRILPIGWEIAAKLSPKDNPVTLSEVYNKFYEASSPYYHLIDRSWLLKAPVARCAAEVYGSQLITQPTDQVPGQRGKYCADIQNCFSENDNGTCDGYGYCLQEKKTWHLGGNSCDAQYNTCTTYTNANGKNSSYLANTIDKGICNADNTGCWAYYNNKEFNSGEWEWDPVKSGSVLTYQPIYFNGKTEQCLETAEGCNKFIRTAFGVEGEAMNLKKAPDYYNCYSGNNLTYSSTTLSWWPVNKTDLSKLNTSLSNAQKQVCGQFAQVCSAEEKGCELYNPTDGRPAVPGILATNDQCPAECAGYETYQEVPLTQFSSSSVSYFIPNTAKQCSAQYSGCEEFINLEPSGQGGETKEHYFKLRTCSKNAEQSSTYYTWEGSDTTGYQLKSYNLMSQADFNPTDSNNFQTIFGDTVAIHDGPAYDVNALTASADLTSFAAKCSSTAYLNRLDPNANLDPDCREFYSQAGDKYYRLYTHTITVSPTECRQLRLAEADQSYCNHAGGTWDTAKKICTFLTIQKESTSCPAEFGGCRAYKGNAGNNFQTVYSQDFEGGVAGQSAQQSTGWLGKISSEATTVGGKSLKVDTSTNIEFTVERGKTTQVYFWAKGASDLAFKVDLTVAGGGSGNLLNQTINLTQDWLPYSVGPFTTNWADASINQATSTITITGNNFFLDNITGKQMVDNIYVVRNSWDTPVSCDNLLNDPIGASQGGTDANPYRLIPQAQLGCSNYTTRQNQPVSIRAFTNLCRAEAVGCEELTDTFNTETTSTSHYNLSCQIVSGLPVQNTTNLPVTCSDENGEARCSILPGQFECKFNYFGNLTFSNGVAQELSDATHNIYQNSSYGYNTVLADRTVYLVNDQKYYCKDSDLGCSAFGPVQYSGTGVKKTTSTETIYLKAVPDKYSDILCELEAEGCQTYATTNGGQSYFKDPATKNQFCEYKTNIDLKDIPGRSGSVTGWFKKGIGVCAATGAISVPTNPTWCSKNEECSGGLTCVGIGLFACSDTGVGGAYATIPTANTPIKYQGFVGLCPVAQNGCAEFLDPAGGASVNNPAGSSYFALDDNKLDRTSCNGQVSTQNGCVLFNQTNKATLTWNTSSTYNLSQGLNYASVNPLNCGVSSVDPNVSNLNCLAGEYNDANTILKVKQDRSCDRWLACKSSRVLDKGSGKEVCTEMAECDEYQNSQSLTGRCAHWVDGTNVVKQIVTSNATPPVNTVSYKNRDVSFGGRDFSGYSIPDVTQIAERVVNSSNLGPLLSTNNNAESDIVLSCRGYTNPEVFLGSESFCSYTKVIYSNPSQFSQSQTKFYAYNELLGAEGLCNGGYNDLGENKTGSKCLTNIDCADDRQKTQDNVSENGSCLLNKKVERMRGWEGYCLFTDPITKACVQWYPINTPNNNISLDDLNRTAGYIPPEGSGKYWCLKAKGNANIPYWKDAYKSAQLISNSYQFVAYNSPGSLGMGLFFPTTPAGGHNGKNETDNILIENVSPYPYINPVDNLPANPPINISEIVAISLRPNIFQSYGSVNNWSGHVPSMESFIFRDQSLSGIPNLSAYNKNADARYWSSKMVKKGNNTILDWVWVERKIGSAPQINYDVITPEFYELNGSDAQSGGNILAFRFIFDENGILYQIRTKIYANIVSNFVTDIIFHLTEVCTDISQVVTNDINNPLVVNSPFGFVSKARTNKVFSGTIGGDINPATGVPYNFISYNQLFAPFGSFNQNNDPSDKYWPIWLAPGGATPLSCGGANSGDCSIVKVGACDGGVSVGKACIPGAGGDTMCSPEPGGICSGVVDQMGKCIGGENDGKTCGGSNGNKDCDGLHTCVSTSYTTGMCVGGSNNGLSCGSNKDCPVKKYIDAVGGEAIEYGVCVGSSLNLGDIIPKTSLISAQNRLNEIFAQVFNTWNWGSNNYSKSVGIDRSSGYQVSDNSQASIVPEPPKVYGLISDCIKITEKEFFSGNPSDILKTLYPSFPVDMLINCPIGFRQDNINPLTVNSLNSGILTSQDKTYPITLNFFAAANSDQMPLTRVAIDWGDATAVTIVKGWFKNHKPICTQIHKVDAGIGFNNYFNIDPEDGFGNSAAACQEDYFTFKHVYSCSSGTCTFIPKVQILDNWGWCNGSGSGNGNWNENKTKNIPDCEPITSNTKAWTSFNGSIKLTP